MALGRFLWRICFFGSGIKVETDLRGRMFDRCKDLSREYYQVNKVGTLMSYFTNDLETVQVPDRLPGTSRGPRAECFRSMRKRT
ncbi:MAG: hypothetical protein IKJ55_06495, partial [Clostridia bacterium]|nr:hypothetical protein [Clostridia bacterium]